MAMLYLVRHAESVGNQDRIMQGVQEYPLSAAGRAAAGAAGPAMRALCPDRVVSSDLSRAVDTAILALGRVDLLDQRLRERSAGPWEGVPRAVLEAAHPGALEDDARRPEGFEPVDAVVSRMIAACQELLTQQGRTVAITHGGSLRLLATALNVPGRRFEHLEGLVIGGAVQVIDRCRFGAET
jgi:probable phosphoglycerate mutase